MSNFSTRYDRKKSFIAFDAASDKAVQDMKRNCDINVIVQQYVTTGTLPTMGKVSFTKRNPMFGDFSEVTDFQTMQNTLKARETAFAELPARVRAKFKNDPNELLKFIDEATTEEKIKEGVDLGIFDKSSLCQFEKIEVQQVEKTAESEHLA